MSEHERNQINKRLMLGKCIEWHNEDYDYSGEVKEIASRLGESAKRFPTRVAIQTNKKGRDELRNPKH